jgi:hypothetical protein
VENGYVKIGCRVIEKKIMLVKNIKSESL